MDVKLPNLGEGADSGTVVSILVKPGAQVRKGQNIIELETGKAVAPIPAPSAGTVTAVRVKEGDKISVGAVILALDPAEGGKGGGTANGAAAGKAESAPTPAPRKAKAAPQAVAPEPEAVSEEPEGDVDGIVNENPVAPPSVRKVARELNLDLRRVAGTGSGGRIVWDDLRSYIARLERIAAQKSRPQAASAAPAPERVDYSQFGSVYKRPMTQLRQVIAQRMLDSRRSIPEVTQFDEADVTALNDLRKKYASAYEAKGVKLTLTSFVLKAAVATLKKHPGFNATLDEAANEIVFKEYYHLGLAVDTEAGLLVPVIRDVDKKDLLQISKDIQEFATKARDRKLGMEEMRGGTFTISNQGGIGGAHFTPVINRPEVAILGLGRSIMKPVVRDEKIVPRLMMPIAVAYDHRVVDGGTAARFTVDLVAAIEQFSESEVKLG